MLSAPAAADDVGRTSPGGLSEEEAGRRRAAGLGNDARLPTGLTVGQIARNNVLTLFNAILGGLFAVILIVGPLQDALFGLVLVLNTGIGVVQELRARRTLDRLALVRAPHVRVVRDGAARPVLVAEVVTGDLVELAPGDQVTVDGVVVSGAADLDESVLTGESAPASKQPGDRVLSGSFAVSGTLRYVADRVGLSSYAATLAAEARTMGLTRSELRQAVNRILRLVTWAIPVAGGLLVWNQLRTVPLADAVRGSVAGVAAMVPEGLVLLTSLAMAVAVVRLGRRRVLVQELAAVEGLARVDVVCLDKTGTLTDGRYRVEELQAVADAPMEAVEAALGALARAEAHPNPSMAALADRFGDPRWQADTVVPFSSATKWSAATFAGRGTWAVGAPEVLLAAGAPVLARVAELASAGARVLLLATADTVGRDGLAGVAPVAVVALREGVRPTAADTVAFFGRQGVAVKVISGDHPATAGSVAGSVGVPGAAAGTAVDARSLPAGGDELADVVEATAVIGRISPHQKRDVVAALQARGHVVAMTGDGVNDVLALRQADLGVALGSGSDATRAAAPVVLLDDDFSTLPTVVAEGRRVIANIERVATLFVTKTVWALLLAVVLGAAGVAYPFLPRQITLVNVLAIGTPAFFLALGANPARAQPGFLRRLAARAGPAGAVATCATLAVYLPSRGGPTAAGVTKTAALLALLGVSVWVLAALARPLSAYRVALLAAVVTAAAGVFAWPLARRMLELHPPGGALLGWTLAAAVLGAAAVEAAWLAASRRRTVTGGDDPAGRRRRAGPWPLTAHSAGRHPGEGPPEPGSSEGERRPERSP